VSINNEPAIHHLIECGLAERSIFLDSLLPWRSVHGASPFAQPIRAYLVQDFPGAADKVSTCRAHDVVLTAPMLWAPRLAVRSAQAQLSTGAVITLHFGGLTSPVAGWSALQPIVENIVTLTLQLARKHSCQLAILGNPLLADLPVCSAPDVRILAGISPAAAARLIRNSALLVTVPGINASLEAMVSDVPTIFLPPLNSTQLHQYRTYTSSGLPGALGDNLSNALWREAALVRWEEQTRFCLNWLSANATTALAGLVPQVDDLLATGKIATQRRTETLALQRNFIGGLAKLDALDALQHFMRGVLD